MVELRRSAWRARSPPWEVLMRRSAGGERHLRRGVRVMGVLRGSVWAVRLE